LPLKHSRTTVRVCDILSACVRQTNFNTVTAMPNVDRIFFKLLDKLLPFRCVALKLHLFSCAFSS